MANVDFGQIPFEVICRFGELGKTEIRVLSYLYACRNQDTGQCNPSRKKICTDTELSKTHLSTSLKNLENDGWILENIDGYFNLVIPEKVTKTVTSTPKKVTESVTLVTDSVTLVTESVTKSYENGNSHIKELNRERNRERTEKEQRSATAPKTQTFERFPEPRSDVQTALWSAFLESRAKMKKPLTEVGYQRLVNQLARLPSFDINDRLIEAVDRKWQGLIFDRDLLLSEGNNAPIQQNNNFKSTADKRDERAISSFERKQQLRAKVEARRIGIS